MSWDRQDQHRIAWRHSPKWMAMSLVALHSLPLVFLSSGCATSMPRKAIDAATLPRIKVGETTRAELELQLGQPSFTEIRMFTQDTILSYISGRTSTPLHEQAIGFLFPLPSTLLLPTHATSESETVSIVVGTDGKVTRVSRELSHVPMKFSPYTGQSMGRKVDWNQFVGIKQGETTVAEVEELLGEPLRIKQESQGQEMIWTYYWMHEVGQVEYVTLTFDPQGKVSKKDSLRVRCRNYGELDSPLDRDNILRIQVGETTRDEVVSFLGRPQSDCASEGQGTTETVMHYMQRCTKEKQCFEGVSITLDDHGVVKSLY